MDFVKSGCEKSWADFQADNFSFECRGCTKMKGDGSAEATNFDGSGKGSGGLCQYFQWGRVGDKVGEAIAGQNNAEGN